MVFDRTFKCTVMGKVYYIKGEMSSESTNIICLITCMKCLERYVGCTIKFKSRFRIHKSDKKLKKIVVGLLSTLMINAVIPTTPFHMYVSSSLRKHIVFMMTVMLKISYETEKNIGTCNYLQISKDSRKISPCKNSHQENSRPSYSPLKIPPPPRKFPTWNIPTHFINCLSSLFFT